MRKFETMTRLKLTPVLHRIAIAAMTLCAGSAYAVGLGTIQVQSGLGQSLQLSIPLIGADGADLLASCIKSRIESSDGAFIAAPSVAILKSSQGQSSILITTRQPVYEPAMSVSVDLACGPRVHRDFQILLDPVGSSAGVSGTAPLANAVAAPISRSRSVIGNSSPAPGLPGGRKEQVATGDGNRRGMLDAAGGIRSAGSLAPLVAVNRNVPSRSVLKLSSQELTAAELASLGQLKLSSQLAESVPSGTTPPDNDITAAQRRYAMLLRGEDPFRQAEQESATQQKQIAALKQQSATGNARHVSDQAAFDELQKNSLSLEWAVGLAALLLGSLGAAGWLAWRLRNLARQQTATPWDTTVLRSETKHASDVAASTTRADDIEAAESVLFAAGQNTNPAPANVPAFLQAISSPASSPATGVAPATKETVETAPPAATVVHEALQFYPARVEHLKVEEISDVMQEAEFWVSLNDPVRAIEILEPYGNLELPESPMPWLFLLDLYRDSDNQSSYEALRERTLRTFNTRIPEWNEVSDIAPAMSLEDFPHVVERICALWGSSEILPYLESLVLDNRDGIRRGFDIEVYQEIMLLVSMARGYDLAQPTGMATEKFGLTLE